MKPLWLRNRQRSTDLAGEQIRRLLMARHSFDVTGLRITPELVFFPFAFEETDGGEARAVSLDDDRLANCGIRNAAEGVFAAILEDERDRLA